MASQRRIDRILADDYLAGLSERTTADIRRMRDECEEEESGLSYARRVLQGRLDILRAEILRRRDAGSEVAASLLGLLPVILGGAGGHGGGPATRVTRFLIPPVVQHHRRAIDDIADDTILATLRTRSDEELGAFVERFDIAERELSTLRRRLLDRIDALQAELTRRYKDGSATVSELLAEPS